MGESVTDLSLTDTAALPAAEGVRQRQRVARIPGWIVLGLVIRLALMPFHHPWDLQTWYNMFVDLAQNHSPYATFHDLTATYRSQRGLRELRESFTARQDMFYEYYAYPPLLMMVYYPLAKAAERVIPLQHQFVIHGPAAQIVVPPLFHLFFKLPLFLAELGIVALLWRLAGRDTARRFFLNPLVILVSATWTVDALIALPVIWSVDLLRRARYVASAAALAAGTLIKFMPAVLLPAVLLHLWHSGVSRRTIVAYGGTFAVVCAVIVAPFWSGFREVLLFQAIRPGANLSIHVVLYPLAILTRIDGRTLDYLANVASPVIGTITLVAALALAYAHLARRARPLSQVMIILLLAFLLGSKVVNESYVYLLIPLLLLELRERPSESKEVGFKILYALPLAFAFVNVPILYAVAPLYRYFWRGPFPVSYDWNRAFPVTAHAILIPVLAAAFVAGCAYVIWIMIRENSNGNAPAAAH